MNAFTYFLTAISEIKKSKFSQDPSTYELAKITSEFETVVEAGSKLPYKPAKVFVYGNLTEWLVSIVHESVVEKKNDFHWNLCHYQTEHLLFLHI